MTEPYLEVTYRHGRVLAAYLYLPRKAGDKSYRTKRAAEGMLIDFHQDGRPIGIELTAPGRVSLVELNKVLADLDVPLLSSEDIAPVLAA